MSAGPAAPARSGLARLRVMQWFGVATAALVAVTVTGFAIGLVAIRHEADARGRLIDGVSPALTVALRLQTALVDQENGIRGFVLTRREPFLDPYRTGMAGERTALARLRALAGRTGGPDLRRAVAAVDLRARAWRRDYAEPAVAAVRSSRRGALGRRQDAVGKARFDAVRRSLAAMQAGLTVQRAGARAELIAAAGRVRAWVIASGLIVVLTVLLAMLGLRRVVVRPLAALAGAVRRVAGGSFERRVRVGGPREIADLARDVDAMREQILAEVVALEAAGAELQRSNAELEQFAYVASHDLQEPLRKVASFCQMLQRRYGGQLDERADQYIEFAVDGAKRMQELINDLLAFSRAGRSTRPLEPVDTGVLVARIEDELAPAAEEAGARFEVGALPTVRGDASLLAVVFRNLLGNAVKFHGDEPPVVRVSAEARGDRWHFTVADNGIGIDDEYAERIFVIFQRLHTRAAYEGTGIGLAMCRKIVEHHGGRIWLEPRDDHGGAVFRFTLPADPMEAAPS